MKCEVIFCMASFKMKLGYFYRENKNIDKHINDKIKIKKRERKKDYYYYYY
jgi:hypothetical protein